MLPLDIAQRLVIVVRGVPDLGIIAHVGRGRAGLRRALERVRGQRLVQVDGVKDRSTSQGGDVLFGKLDSGWGDVKPNDLARRVGVCDGSGDQTDWSTATETPSASRSSMSTAAAKVPKHEIDLQDGQSLVSSEVGPFTDLYTDLNHPLAPKIFHAAKGLTAKG